jgi:diguanylate cyclase (GGDEF)-like protein
LPRDAILREFREQSGKQFDPWVVEAMLAVIEEEELELHAEAEHDHEAAPAAALSGPRSWLQHLETIEALGARLARAASIEEICQLLGETIVTILPQDQCRILLLAADRRRLEVAYLSAGARVEYQGVTIENAGVELGEGITGWVAQTKRGVVIGDAERHPKAAHVSGTNQIDESLLAAPVVYHDELLGVILVLKVGLNQYNLDHLRLLTILANQVAVAIANVRLSAQLASAARTDALTGLSNRQALQDALENQIRNPAARFSIIVLDVEQLKQTNDALGMGAGDRVLRRVADVLRAVLRKDDIAARWVSDQFVVILPGFGDLAARAVAKRIWTELLKPGDGEEAITVHWGTASCPEHGSSWDELFTWAERSLQGARQERQEPAA